MIFRRLDYESMYILIRSVEEKVIESQVVGTMIAYCIDLIELISAMAEMLRGIYRFLISPFMAIH